jgi:hypothetical protein
MLGPHTRKDNRLSRIMCLRKFDYFFVFKYTTKTITVIITALHGEGHQGPPEQGFISNHLHGTDVTVM